MRLVSNSFPNGAPIPARYALGVPDPTTHVTFGQNLNPHLAWTGAPAETRSFALICHDRDVPSVGTDVNQEGRTVPHDLPRADFFHWVLVDIPPAVSEIAEGAVSRGVTERGKPLTTTGLGRTGRNSYTEWFTGDAAMEGEYGGYDGPCPPWNDERIHHYHFTIFALDVDRLTLPGSFGGDEARAAMEGHILDSADWVGSYRIYADAW